MAEARRARGPRQRRLGYLAAGFCQFITGVILFIGMTWLQVFISTPALYMAALAFSAYGIHWFAIGWNGSVNLTADLGV